jgi:ribosomal protein S18 acetylase RimI-like enzyme
VLPPPIDEAALDNVVWHALNGPLARFAERAPSARGASPAALRFDPAVAVFGAVEQLDAASWQSLASLLGVGGSCALARAAVSSPPVGWQELARIPLFQMIGESLREQPTFDFELLGPDDFEEMFALATLTEPGPFLLRTPELGRFIGVRREGRLVAMAGQRFRTAGVVEVSAVCTHPDARGEGLAAALTLEIAHFIREQGDVPFLHVTQTNESAVRLYRKLGFRIRRPAEVVVVQWCDDGLAADAPRPGGDGD